MKWFLDNTQDVCLAILRGAGMLLPAVAIVLSLASIWIREDGAWWRLLLSAALLLLIGGGAGYIGFYLYGNEEWRPNRGDAER